MKKSFLYSLVFPLLLVSLVVFTPLPAHAWRLEPLSFAAIFSSVFSKVKSFLKGETTSPAKPPEASPETIVQANCVPPVPPKTAVIDVSEPYKPKTVRSTNIDASSKYGSITVTPEASTAGPDNIVTISVTPKILDSIHNISFSVPVGGSKSDLIDWYPKDPAFRFNHNGIDSEKGNFVFGWGVDYYNKNQKTLPIDQTYWVKIRLRHASIPEKAKNAIVSDGWNISHGWRQVKYDVSNLSTNSFDSRGFHGIYVGREQKPSLITTIPNYDSKTDALGGSPHFVKSFKLVPNEHFEIQTKSLGQPGTITLKLKYAKVIGDETRVVKADETITWKIQPLFLRPPLLLELGLKNNCGQDYFMDPAKSSKLSELDQFKFPVVYDFEKLTSDMVNITVGARNPDVRSLSAGASYYEESFPVSASLFTKGETKVPVPDVPITFQAVYKDKPMEIAKNFVFQMYASGGNGRKGAGEITINTLKDSTGIGSAHAITLGSKLTEEDAGRGIIIKATSGRFPGLSAEIAVPLVVPEKAEPQSKPPAPVTPSATPPSSKPTVTPQWDAATPSPEKPATGVSPSMKISGRSLVITSDRKLEGLKEGDKITFTAKLLMSDGSLRVLKENVQWGVVGQIGSITAAGEFSAKLSDAIAEYGEGIGGVVATYLDSGAPFLAQSPIFEVQAFVPEESGETGG